MMPISRWIEVLTYGGLLPLVAANLAIWLLPEFSALGHRAAYDYVVVIYCFMAGTLWGRCIAQSEQNAAKLAPLIISNLLALAMWLWLWLGQGSASTGYLLCIAGFGCLYLAEKTTLPRAPLFYVALRQRVSLLIMLLLALLAYQAA